MSFFINSKGGYLCINSRTTRVDTGNSVSITGNANINGVLNISGNVSFLNSINLSGQLIVSNLSIISSNILATGTMNVIGNLIVTKDTTVTNNINVLTNLTASGYANIANIDATSITIANDSVSTYTTSANFLYQSANVLIPPGTITMYGGSSVPSGWLLCDGNLYSKTTYSSLYSLSSNTTANVTGSYFYVPNMAARFPIGCGGLYTINETAGNSSVILTTSSTPSHTHVLTITQDTHTHTMPSHTHTATIYYASTKLYTGNQGDIYQAVGYSTSGKHNRATETTYDVTDSFVNITTPSASAASNGSATAFSIMNPYLAINYIIKY